MKNEIKIPVSSIQDVKTKKMKLFKKHPLKFTAFGLSSVILITMAPKFKEERFNNYNINNSKIAANNTLDIPTENGISTLENKPLAITISSTATKGTYEERKAIAIQILKHTDKYPHYFSNFLDDYIDYKLDHPNLSIDDVISRVNLGIIYPFYSFYLEEPNLDKNYALINKFNIICKPLYSDYLKDNKLEGINGSKKFKLRSDACNACEAMIRAAKKRKINLSIKSAFVSGDDQEKLYNDTVDKLGKEKADLIVERPYYSYAQLGTKIVFNVKAGSNTAKWLAANAYKYGFVYVAPKGKEDITGYTYNPGSFHYIGKKYATEMHKLGVCFDEYWIRYLFPGAIIHSSEVENFTFNTNDEEYKGKAKIYSKI